MFGWVPVSFKPDWAANKLGPLVGTLGTLVQITKQHNTALPTNKTNKT